VILNFLELLIISKIQRLLLFVRNQDTVGYYTSELQICKSNADKQKKNNERHLDDIQSLGKFDFHHNFFQGAVDRNQKFYQPRFASETSY
jgi:hypothetical protein